MSVLHGLKTDVIANLGKMRSAAGTWDQSLLRKGTGFRNGEATGQPVELWSPKLFAGLSVGSSFLQGDSASAVLREHDESQDCWNEGTVLMLFSFFSQTWFCTESILPFVGFKFHSVIRQESFCAGHGRAEAKQERIHCRCVSKDFGQQGGVQVT